MDAQQVLKPLVGTTIRTLTGRPNRVIAIRGQDVIVATGKSPEGKPVPIAWIQDALDRLVRNGEIEISVPSVGYRSAFIGAVLATIDGSSTSTRPRRVRLSTHV
jgi:hypothetical protein